MRAYSRADCPTEFRVFNFGTDLIIVVSEWSGVYIQSPFMLFSPVYPQAMAAVSVTMPTCLMRPVALDFNTSTSAVLRSSASVSAHLQPSTELYFYRF